MFHIMKVTLTFPYCCFVSIIIHKRVGFFEAFCSDHSFNRDSFGSFSLVGPFPFGAFCLDLSSR